MQKHKTFWHVFKHSLVPLDYYYKQILRTQFTFSLKYFISLLFITVTTSFLIKGYLFVQKYPPAKLDELLMSAEEQYPDDLSIVINENNRLSTNYDKPFILFSPLESRPEPLIVVDPKATKDKLDDYDTKVLLTERYAIIKSQNQSYEFTYDSFAGKKVTKTDVQMIAHNAQVVLESYWTFIIVLMLVSVLLVPPLAITFTFSSLAIASFVVFILTSLLTKRKGLTFSKILQISLHTFTAPAILQSLLFITGTMVSIPYWNLIILYVFLIGGVYEAYFEKRKA